MLVNRSGYYKWLARKDKPNRYEQDRIILTELQLEQHNKHKTKGYHYLANLIRNETVVLILVRKVDKSLQI